MPKSSSTRHSRSKHSIDVVTLIAAGAPLIFILGMVAGYYLRSFVQTTEASPQTVTPETTRLDVSADDDPSIGPENAAVTIIEFGDYQSPACVQWYDQVFERLLTSYPTQVRFIFRDFPLYTIHDQAISAAEAAECADDQDKFWDFQAALFSSKYGYGETAYIQYATDIGLDIDSFSACTTSHKYQAEVRSDYTYGVNIGVEGTPAFYINGLFLNGAYPYETFKQIIDLELAKNNQ